MVTKRRAKSEGQVTSVEGLDILPIGDRVVVRRDPVEDVSPGGIIMPDMAIKEKPRFGTVIAKGPGVLRQVPLMPASASDPLMEVDEQKRDRYPMQIEVGDRVIVSHYAESVEIGEEEVVIIRESEVLAILR